MMRVMAQAKGTEIKEVRLRSFVRKEGLVVYATATAKLNAVASEQDIAAASNGVDIEHIAIPTAKY